VRKGNPQKFLPLQSTHPAQAGCKPQGAHNNIPPCQSVASPALLPPIPSPKVRQRTGGRSEDARNPTTAYTAPTLQSSPTLETTGRHHPPFDKNYSRPWTSPCSGTAFRRRLTRMLPSDSRPNSTSSMCVCHEQCAHQSVDTDGNLGRRAAGLHRWPAEHSRGRAGRRHTPVE
jgi:hypothetical protein